MKKVYIIIGIIALLWLSILVTETKILVREAKVEPGQKYYLEGYGDLGENEQASIICRYFNGRKIVTNVFWYSPNNILGKDSCPFMNRE